MIFGHYLSGNWNEGNEKPMWKSEPAIVETLRKQLHDAEMRADDAGSACSACELENAGLRKQLAEAREWSRLWKRYAKSNQSALGEWIDDLIANEDWLWEKIFSERAKAEALQKQVTLTKQYMEDGVIVLNIERALEVLPSKKRDGDGK